MASVALLPLNEEGVHGPKKKESEPGPRCRLLVFIVFTQVVQMLMSYDGGATQFCTVELQAMGWTAAEMGVLGAMDKFGQVATASWCGELLRRYNAKTLLAFGLFWKAVCCFAFGFLQHLGGQPMSVQLKGAMLTTKLGMGITEALVSVWATVWVQHNAPPDARARWMSFAGTSAGIGSGIGSGVASLWSPVYAFCCQAVCIFATWLLLLFMPWRSLEFTSGDVIVSPRAALEETMCPELYLFEWVGHRLHQHRVVFIESVRLPGQYLDASEDLDDHGFRLRITKGDPHNGDWALFRLIEQHGGHYSLESVRHPCHLLDGTSERAGVLDAGRKVRLTEGLPSQEWSHFHIHKMDDDVHCIESINQPQHYLDASGERLRKGTKVRMTCGNPSDCDPPWAHFRMHDAGVGESCFGTDFVKPEVEDETFAAKVYAILNNPVWLWTAMAISLNCFVTTGVAYYWQNTLKNIWQLDNNEIIGCFYMSTAIGGLVGIVMGPKLFDGHLGGFATSEGKARCLHWCQRMTLLVAACATICVVMLVMKADYLIHNELHVVYWELALLLSCVFIIFMLLNAMTGTLYAINTDATASERRTFAAGLTVAFQNVFGFAFGPLLPGSFASLVATIGPVLWPGVETGALSAAQYAGAMGMALMGSWALYIFTRRAANYARISVVSRRALSTFGLTPGDVGRNSP